MDPAGTHGQDFIVGGQSAERQDDRDQTGDRHGVSEQHREKHHEDMSHCGDSDTFVDHQVGQLDQIPKKKHTRQNPDRQEEGDDGFA